MTKANGHQVKFEPWPPLLKCPFCPDWMGWTPDRTSLHCTSCQTILPASFGQFVGSFGDWS